MYSLFPQEFQGPITPPTPVYPPGNRILATSSRRSEGTLTTEGAANDSASALAMTGYLVGAFVMFVNDGGDDVGYPIFRTTSH